MVLEGGRTDGQTAPRVMGISELALQHPFPKCLDSFPSGRKLFPSHRFPACRISSETLPGWLLNSDPRIFSRCRRFFRVCAEPGWCAVAAGCGGPLLVPPTGRVGAAGGPHLCELSIAGVSVSVRSSLAITHLVPSTGRVLGSRGACVFPSCLP